MRGHAAVLMAALGLSAMAAPQSKVERKAVFCGGAGDWELSKCCALSGKENPRLLLFCTANGDVAWSVEGAAKQGAKFTTNAEVIRLFPAPETSAAEVRAKILAADVIFFYGGATEKIAERLSFWHLDDALRLAYARGTVLAGFSAGAIILSHAGLTDFPNDRYDLISGLGVVDCYFCPHYEGGRWKEFDARLGEETDDLLPREAWAIECGMAVVFRDGRPEVVSNNPKGHVYRFTRNQGVWTKREVPAPITPKTAVTKPGDVLFKDGDLIAQSGDSITAYGRTLGTDRRRDPRGRFHGRRRSTP